MPLADLTDRERKVLEAVIQTYVLTASPAGSRQLARRFRLGVSPATVRNTMSDLEEKGYLFHPHTSAGRVPTNAAYRAYVDSILPAPSFSAKERETLLQQITAGGNAVENILRRAAQSLGVVTQELGVALGPRFGDSTLDRVELVRLASDRLLVVLSLQGGGVRTIYVGCPRRRAGSRARRGHPSAQRAAGRPDAQSTPKLAQRAAARHRARDRRADQHLRRGRGADLRRGGGCGQSVVLGQASVLAEQPEFASADSMRRLVALTETRHYLAEVLRRRAADSGVSITIGSEHGDPALDKFTLVTAQYRAGTLNGVIGVIGPTRMPYDKVISLVTHTSQLITELLD